MTIANTSGAILERYRYTAYGVPTFLNGAGAVIPATQITNATLFTGRRYDAETGLYYYRTRYLDPLAGRFNTRDSIGIWGDPGEMGNGYTYVGNDPIGETDPTGQYITCGGEMAGGWRVCCINGGTWGTCCPVRNDGQVGGCSSWGALSTSGTFSGTGGLTASGTGGSCGSSGSERALINTSRSNIKHQALTISPSSGNSFFDVFTELIASGSSGGTRGTEPWCLNHPLECALAGTAIGNPCSWAHPPAYCNNTAGSSASSLAGPGNSTDFTANGPIVALLRNISTGPGDIRLVISGGHGPVRPGPTNPDPFPGPQGPFGGGGWLIANKLNRGPCDGCGASYSNGEWHCDCGK